MGMPFGAERVGLGTIQEQEAYEQDKKATEQLIEENMNKKAMLRAEEKDRIREDEEAGINPYDITETNRVNPYDSNMFMDGIQNNINNNQQ